MKCVYPIVLSQGKEFIVVYVPDFNINTQGRDMADAIEMARDAIGLMGIDMQDDGEEFPVASSLKAIRAESEGDTVTLVDVDFDLYRRRHEMRTVRKNVSLPSWLNEEAERANINFSAVLQNALKAELRL